MFLACLILKLSSNSSELLEEQEKFDNKVVDLFSYKTYEGLSAVMGYSYFGDGDYTLTYSTENIPHDFCVMGCRRLNGARTN